MKHQSKLRKRIAMIMAVTLIAMSLPIDAVYAEPDEPASSGTATIRYEGADINLLEFSADDYAQGMSKQLSVAVKDSYGNDVTVVNDITWYSDNQNVVTVDRSGVVTPTGAGEAIITYTQKYTVSDGDVESATASVTVTVYAKPVLSIKIEPESEATYPNLITISVEGCPEGITPELKIDGTIQPNPNYQGVLGIGTHNIEATTSALGYYVESNASCMYSVEEGTVNFSVDASKEDSVYYSEIVSYTVTTDGVEGMVTATPNNASVEGNNSVTVDRENSTAIFTVRYDRNIATAGVTFAFVPSDSNYGAPADISKFVNVQKIPVKAVWNDSANFTKTYDGYAYYTPSDALSLELDGVTGFNINTTVNTDDNNNYFDISEADVGTYEGIYAGRLTLSDDTYYELTNPRPTQTITVTPIILSVNNNIDKGEGIGKAYDGECNAKFLTTPSLVDAGNFANNEFTALGLTLDYIAYYADNDGNEVYGTAIDNNVATKIVLSNLAVKNSDGIIIGNYVFPEGITVSLEGAYTITKNDEFDVFTGITDLGMPFEDTYWFNSYTLQKEGFEFSTVEKRTTWWGTTKIKYNWKDSIIINSEVSGKTIVARDKDTNKISDVIVVGYDADFPAGYVYASIDGQKQSITDLVETYNTIKKDSVIEIIFSASDSKSKIKDIEWYGTDTPVTVNDVTTWPTSGTMLIAVDGENYEQPIVRIDKTELKKFYYGKVTDHAGNVTYISSSGVLQDTIMPIVTALTLSTADGTYNGTDVYGEGTIDFRVDMMETGLTSGISDVKVTLQLNEETPKEYDINSDIWSVSDGDAVSSIRVLKSTATPNNAEINNASGVLMASATLSGLADGNKYTLTVVAYDKAGNESIAVSKQFIVDSKEPITNIDLSGLEYNENRKGDEIFTGGSIVVTVEDMTLVTNLSTVLSGISGVTWQSTTRKDGCVTYTAEIPFGKNTVNQEAVYQIKIDVEDALGKTSNSEMFVNVDDTAPTYTVEFSSMAANAEQIRNTKYYNSDIVATFVIDEEGNYSDSLIAINVNDGNQNTVIAWKDGVATTLIGNNNYVLSHERDSKEFVLTIKADNEFHSTDDLGYTFTILGQDKAGNDLVADESVGNAISEIRAMDTIAPDLTNITYDTIEAFKVVSSNGVSKDFVNADTAITVTLVEKNPIISTYAITSEGGQDKDVQWESVDGGDTYKVAFEVPQYGVKGDEQTVVLKVMDVAGNAAVMTADKRSEVNTTFVDGIFTDKFTVDKVAPTIKYDYLTYSPSRENVSGVDYFNRPIEIQITVDEHNFEESLIDFAVERFESGVTYGETAWKTINQDIHVKTLTLSADSEYLITANGGDCADNLIKLIPIDGITSTSAKDGETAVKVAVDKTIPNIGDKTKPVVIVSPSAAGSTDGTSNQSSQTLYNNSITYEVAVYDPKTNNFCSGIDGITFMVTGENGAKATATVSADGSIISDIGVTVSRKSGSVTNLGKGKENQYLFDVSIDKNVFNSNAIVLSVETRDYSTNHTSIFANAVAIDITAPIATIIYDNNEVSNDRYFHANRTVTVEVKERNFSSDCLNFMVNGQNIGLQFSNVSVGNGNRDDAVYRATYVFDKDGDFAIDCTVKDKAGNIGTVNYNGEANKNFTIDKTLPIIAVSYDNNQAVGDNYFDIARTATIRIEEHNFNSSDVVITGTATDDGASFTYPTISAWRTDGDVHEATISYVADGKYTLDVAYIDLATNEAVVPETSSFVIDKTDPEITIIGVEEGKAYPDEVIPEISFSDTNYDNVDITLYRTERDKHNVDVTDKFVGESSVIYSSAGRGVGKNIIKDIEHLAENDGIYTLIVRVQDKAGRSTETSVTYSVNRFGSVYVYSDDLSDLIGGYYQDVIGDLHILVYNANELEEDATKLQIICDGSSIPGQKSVANAKDALVGSDGWHVYKFAINKDDFVNDGAYEITLSDKDKAGNTRTNSDAPIGFYVDNTAPILDSVIGLEEAIVNAESQTVEYTISDAIGLENVSVYVDDVLVTSIDEFDVTTCYTGNFVLGAGMRQNIRIVAVDKADNVLDTSAEGFKTAYAFNSAITVSTNVLVRWYANTVLFWGSIAAVAGAFVLAILILIFTKGKKKEIDEEI